MKIMSGRLKGERMQKPHEERGKKTDKNIEIETLLGIEAVNKEMHGKKKQESIARKHQKERDIKSMLQ